MGLPTPIAPAGTAPLTGTVPPGAATTTTTATTTAPPLPEPLVDTLPIFPFVASWSRVLMVALLVAAIVWWIRRRRRRRAMTAQAPVAAPPPIPASDATAAIDAIEQHHTEAGSFRAGCHELDREVRRRLGRAVAIDLEPLTASEVETLFEEREVGRLAVRLRDAGFGREEPGRDQFRGLCRDARNVVAGSSGSTGIRNFKLRRASGGRT